MSAFNTMEINWSPVVMFRKIPVPTVDETKLNLLCIKRTMTRVILSIIPLATIAAPKHMAQSINHIVFSIPAIPFVEISSFSEENPVSRAVAP